MDELLADLREQAGTSKRSDQAVEARSKLVDVLLDTTDILLPEDVVAHEITHRVADDASAEEKDAARTDVERELREEILSESLAERYNVQVSQQELIDYMIQMSQAFGTDINQLIQDSSQVSQMVSQLGRTKALIEALRAVTVQDSAGEVVDLTPFFGEPDSESTEDSDRAEGADDIAATLADDLDSAAPVVDVEEIVEDVESEVK